MSRTAYYYQTKKSDDEVVKALSALTDKHKRWGFPKCFQWLRKNGFSWNHKRVYRIYRENGFTLTTRKKKRYPVRLPEKLAVPMMKGECWSIDFMSDSLSNGVRFRTFNVLDDFNREALGIDVNVGMPSSRVTRYLDQIASEYGYPRKIRCDNGPEFLSKTFINWANQHRIDIDYIEPGSPYQNGFIERFNRSYREEILDLHLFDNLKEVRFLTTEWLEVYNYERPHKSLGYLTPKEFSQLN